VRKMVLVICLILAQLGLLNWNKDVAVLLFLFLLVLLPKSFLAKVNPTISGTFCAIGLFLCAYLVGSRVVSNLQNLRRGDPVVIPMYRTSKVFSFTGTSAVIALSVEFLYTIFLVLFGIYWLIEATSNH